MKEIWVDITIIYLGFELFLFTLTGILPVFTMWWIEKIVRLILGKKSCVLGYHWWEYKTKKHKAEGIKHVDQVEVYERQCKGKCEKHQYSFQHPGTKLFDDWITGTLRSLIKFERV